MPSPVKSSPAPAGGGPSAATPLSFQGFPVCMRLGRLKVEFQQPSENGVNRPYAYIRLHAHQQPLAQLRVPCAELGSVLETFSRADVSRAPPLDHPAPRALQQALERMLHQGAELRRADGTPGTSTWVAERYAALIARHGADDQPAAPASKPGLIRKIWQRFSLQSAHAIAATCSFSASLSASAAVPHLLPHTDLKTAAFTVAFYGIGTATYWVPFFLILRHRDRIHLASPAGVLNLEEYRRERQKDLPNIFWGEVTSAPVRMITLQQLAGLFPREFYLCANFLSWLCSNVYYISIVSLVRNRLGPWSKNAAVRFWRTLGSSFIHRPRSTRTPLSVTSSTAAPTPKVSAPLTDSTPHAP